MNQIELDKCLNTLEEWIKLQGIPEPYRSELDMGKFLGIEGKSSVSHIIKAWDKDEKFLFSFSWQDFWPAEEVVYLCEFYTNISENSMETKNIDYETLKFLLNRIKI
jgi:hypothetical protein